MEQVETSPPNTPADTSPGPQPETSSSSPEYSIQPFVTMPEKDSTNLDTSLPSQPPSTSSPQNPSNAENLTGPVIQTEPSNPFPANHPTSRDASTSGPATVMFPPSSMQANTTVPAQSSSPSDPPTNSHPDEPHNISVTVQAVPGQASKNSPESVVPAPSRGAVIALGVLTAFFVTLIVVLLLWRRRQERRKKPSDLPSEMQDKEKGDSAPPSRSTSSSHRPLTTVPPPKAHAKAGPGIPNPFGRRGITRPSRPASLPLDSRIAKAERMQKAQSQEVKAQARPSSWRSSIAGVWESLGLPSRVLHDPNSHFWSDSVSVTSEDSTRNLVSRPSAIPEEMSMRAETDAPTPNSDIQSTRSHSPAPSRKTTGSVNTNAHNLQSSSSSQPSERQDSGSLVVSGQDTQSISRSNGSLDSHTTCSDHSCKSPTESSPVKDKPKLTVDAVENTSVKQNLSHSPIGSGSLDSHTISSDRSCKSPDHSSPVKNNEKFPVIALENTQVTQTIPI
ncbi:hypothetical protein PGT21_024294 [Puccinia graminis f. sp. tritici]|uniref:Uncharacterized protein n=1 Tax=Puccinia graminis f. sp. tritici TaxID=56615 RepID=A0A5B0RF15_PUCGR|nr:hypothetical protein PGT21_024294 [Puccinia graminis f. sp. tritici]KAA1124002.1 hypothetical protein PGTUg99_018128 [Puccinia graminis f. sp. tritici]